MALFAPRLKYMVAMASASAQLSATTVAESNRDVTLRPVVGSIVWDILLPAASR